MEPHSKPADASKRNGGLPPVRFKTPFGTFQIPQPFVIAGGITLILLAMSVADKVMGISDAGSVSIWYRIMSTEQLKARRDAVDAEVKISSSVYSNASLHEQFLLIRERDEIDRELRRRGG